MFSIMRKLRSGSRQETLEAVKVLLSSCSVGIGPEFGQAGPGGNSISTYVRNTEALSEMREAGALQILLTALVRSQKMSWPDVETQISKIVSVLVTFEDDDSQLLLKNALEILSTLYLALVATTERMHIANIARSRTNSASGPSPVLALELLSLKPSPARSAISATGNTNSSSGSSSDTNSDRGSGKYSHAPMLMRSDSNTSNISNISDG